MLSRHLLQFIVLLSSAGLLPGQRAGGHRPIELALGLVNIQTVAVGSSGESHMSGGIVVRLTRRDAGIRSFALSNEAGIAVVPLPAGNYCYDAFSQAGKELNLVRKPIERCFTVVKDGVVEVGVEFSSELVL